MTPNQILSTKSHILEEAWPTEIKALQSRAATVDPNKPSVVVGIAKQEIPEGVDIPTKTSNGTLPPREPTLTTVIEATNPSISRAQQDARHNEDERGATKYQVPSPVQEDVIGANGTEKVEQPPLGPIDRLVAAKKSRALSRKVTEYSRQARSLDYHTKFLPEQKIRELVDPTVVSHELTRSRKGSLITQESRQYCKILTVLYLLDLPTKVRLFVLRGVCDDHLPLEIIDDKKDRDGSVPLRSVKNKNGSLVYFKKRGDAEDFVKHQWSVLAHVFSPPKGSYVPHHILHDNEVLPFRGHVLMNRQGASGEVSRTWIHPDHHCWDRYKTKTNNSATCNLFAVKTLRSKDRCKFNQEVNVLRKLSKERHRHPHLITLLATYEQKQIFSLIFPLAEADLFGFWKHNKTPRRSAAMARWIAEQCKGLAEALSRIHRWQTFSGSSVITEDESECDHAATVAPQHESSPTDRAPRNYFGRHGDLKPENILWYEDDPSSPFGILKITDFGIAQVSKDYSRKGVMPNSPTYRSPEFELQESHSPACDVWALGCVYLEFTAWYCGGHDLVEAFAHHRLAFDERFGEIKSDTFFTIYYSSEQPDVKEAKVKDSVVALIGELLTHPTCETYKHFQELLEIIRDKMLIVHPSRPDNTSNDLSLQRSQSGSGLTRRKSSGQVADSLGSLSVFENDVVEISRQNTLNLNAASRESGIIRSIPGILSGSTSAPQSPVL